MQEATNRDLWNSGLIRGPEPRGRRSPDELAAMRGDRDRNFAQACFNLNERWEVRRGQAPPGAAFDAGVPEIANSRTT
jgi:hypothetical protein